MVYLKIRSTHPLVHPPCQTHPNWIRLVTDPINPPIQISICPHYIPVNPYFPFRVSHEFPLSLNFSGILCKNHQDPIKSAHNQFPINFPSIPISPRYLKDDFLLLVAALGVAPAGGPAAAQRADAPQRCGAATALHGALRRGAGAGRNVKDGFLGGQKGIEIGVTMVLGMGYSIYIQNSERCEWCHIFI